MNRHLDTIAACITGLNRAAIAVIRVSGPQAWQVAKAVFQSWPDEPESHRALYGEFAQGDDGLALPFAEGRSYTGEQTVEFSIHGSPASVQALLELCLAAGARMAGPGEFTQRAFLNGRLDLTQAEGVRDTIEAQTQTQLRQAERLRQGELMREIGAIRERLISVLTAIEASTDFSEEVGELDESLALSRLEEADAAIDQLLAGAAASQILRQGLQIALVGQPNAGKSSLLNRLMGSDRAIVTAIPGTTRDTLSETVDLGGIPCVITDTAGLRETEDEIERMGVERSWASVRSADWIWLIYDAQAGWTEADEALLSTLPAQPLILANKSDLAEPERGLPLSALTGQGITSLIEEVRNQAPELSDSPAINQRHTTHLRQAKECIAEARQAIESPVPNDLAVVGLQSGVRVLGEITGETAPPDLIEQIFHDFCIGK